MSEHNEIKEYFMTLLTGTATNILQTVTCIAKIVIIERSQLMTIM
jgi:hypothetical protein